MKCKNQYAKVCDNYNEGKLSPKCKGCKSLVKPKKKKFKSYRVWASREFNLSHDNYEAIFSIKGGTYTKKARLIVYED